MVRYIGTSPSEPLALHPRGVFRVVVGRAGGAYLSFLTGTLRWRQVVEGMIDRSASPAGFPLGGGLDNVTNRDLTAVVDYRVASHPGTLTVSALVRAVEEATPFSNVVSIARIGPVPRESAGGAGALAGQRDDVQGEANRTAEAESPIARITGVLKGTRTVLVAGAIIALVVLAVVYLPKPRS